MGRRHRADDLRAWCRALVEAKDWKAALAARQLGRRHLPARLERAWREAPSLLRLRRWLGSAGSTSALNKRAAAALEACPHRTGPGLTHGRR